MLHLYICEFGFLQFDTDALAWLDVEIRHIHFNMLCFLLPNNNNNNFPLLPEVLVI